MNMRTTTLLSGWSGCTAQQLAVVGSPSRRRMVRHKESAQSLGVRCAPLRATRCLSSGQRKSTRLHFGTGAQSDSRVSLSRADSIWLQRARVEWRDGSRTQDARNIGACAKQSSPASDSRNSQRQLGCKRLKSDGWRTSATSFTRPGQPARRWTVAQGWSTRIVASSMDNLFIASSSVFPTSGHANPVFSMAALAIRLADHLKLALERAESSAALD